MSLSFFPSSPAAAPSRSARFSPFAYIASRPFIARVSLSCHPLFPFVSSLSCSHTRSCGVTYHSRHVIELCVFEARLCSNPNYAFFSIFLIAFLIPSARVFVFLSFAPYFIKRRINTHRYTICTCDEVPITAKLLRSDYTISRHGRGTTRVRLITVFCSVEYISDIPGLT